MPAGEDQSGLLVPSEKSKKAEESRGGGEQVPSRMSETSH